MQGLITIAVEELCETANALLAPVRLGVARPTAPFALSSSANSDAASIEELFSAEPVAPRLRGGEVQTGGSGGGGRGRSRTRSLTIEHALSRAARSGDRAAERAAQSQQPQQPRQPQPEQQQQQQQQQEQQQGNH